MATYTETKSTLDLIAQRSEANRKRINAAKVQIANALSDLAGMAGTYGAFATQLDTDAAANPTDEAWQTALAEKNQMVTDFQALKARAEAINTAITAL